MHQDYINDIIEMIEKRRSQEDGVIDPFCAVVRTTCDDIIDQLLKMSYWQPIDTAPKDGTHFLGYREGKESYSEAWWRPDVQSFGGNGWHYPDNSGPTHWMPLPPKPTGGVK